jgi:ribose 5-phosphate isomerase RpiB
LEHLYALVAEDLVEAATKLAVAVVDQEVDRSVVICE